MSITEYNRKNPFMATVTKVYCLSEGGGKETNHYEISLKNSGIRYKPGDSLGFYPTNDSQLVKQTIRKIKAKLDDIIETKEIVKKPSTLLLPFDFL